MGTAGRDFSPSPGAWPLSRCPGRKGEGQEGEEAPSLAPGPGAWRCPWLPSSDLAVTPWTWSPGGT